MFKHTYHLKNGITMSSIDEKKINFDEMTKLFCEDGIYLLTTRNKLIRVSEIVAIEEEEESVHTFFNGEGMVRLTDGNKELVYNPSHYNKEGRKSCWDEMLDKFGADDTIVFDLMNAYKYSYRAGAKDGNPKEQDLEKIKNYIKHATKLLEENALDESTRALYRKMMIELNQ